MNAREHYDEAARLIAIAGSVPGDVDVTHTLAAAQVHATLALAAASLEARSDRYDRFATGGPR